ncbi:MAG: hypothetical protein H8K03_12075 [Nitrospira sp.]
MPQLIPDQLRDQLVKEALESFNDISDWTQARPAGFRPVYDIDGNAAYYEVSINDRQGINRGYVLVAATENDLPILELSETARPPSHQLAVMVGDQNFKMVYFGPGYIAAEDTNGNLIAEIGERPTVIPSEARLHTRGEGSNFRPVPPRDPLPAVPRQEIKRRLTQWSYAELKRTFVRPQPAAENLASYWSAAKSPNSPCTFNVRASADAPKGHSYFLQIPQNKPPNTNDHASGCGATAWMNLFGWHNLNFTPSLLDADRRDNDPYIENLTMALHDYLGTYEPWWTFDSDQGFTWPEDMARGFEFVRTRLHHTADYWYRQDWWNTDESWVFQVGRDAIKKKRPFIVGYYSDLHYAIGYQTRECTGHMVTIQVDRANTMNVRVVHRYIHIYTGWSNDDSKDKWIPISTIFGIWAAYDFRKLPSGSVGEEIKRYFWSSGWTTVEFYQEGPSTYLFSLKSNNGLVHITRMNADGTVGPRIDTRDWSSGWTHAKPFQIGAASFLLILKEATGEAHIYKINSGGSVGAQVARYDWSAGWTTVEFYQEGPWTYLFTLKSSNGLVHVTRMNADGTVGPRIDTRDWSSGWTHAKPFKIGATTFLCLLKEGTGESHFHKIHHDGSTNE